MPVFSAPRSDIDRVAFLQRAAVTGAADLAAGNTCLSTETVSSVKLLAQTFDMALSDISSSQSSRSRELRQRQEAIALLETYVRDFWEVARRRARRQGQPDEVLTFYGLPLDGSSPHPTRSDEWLTIAANVVRGDVEAVAAGYPAMSNPSAAEITAVLDTAQTDAAEAAAADRLYDQAQEQLADLRAQADQMIADVMAELRFTLRRKSAPSQRRIMRTYGAAFDYLPGESPDPDDEPEPPPAAPA